MSDHDPYWRTAPAVPGFAGGRMSVGRPAIKAGQWRTSAKQKRVIAVVPAVGLTGGRGSLELGRPAAKAKPGRPYKFTGVEPKPRKSRRPNHYPEGVAYGLG